MAVRLTEIKGFDGTVFMYECFFTLNDEQRASWIDEIAGEHVDQRCISELDGAISTVFNGLLISVAARLDEETKDFLWALAWL